MWAYIADCWVCRQDVGSVPCSSVGPAPHATVPVVDQVPEGFTSLPSAPQDHSDAQRLPRSEAVEKTSVPPERSPAGSVPSSQDYNGHIPDGLGGGGGPSRMSSVGNLVRETYKSVGTTSILPGSQAILTTIEGLSCVSQDGQHNCSFIPESSGRTRFSSSIQIG